MKQQKHTELLSILWGKLMSLSIPSSGSPLTTEVVSLIRQVWNELRSSDKGGYFLPRIRLPNIKKFRIKITSPHHPILAKAGLHKRKYNPLIESEKYLNRRINRYLEHQFIRLNKNVTQPALYWRICEYLLCRSAAYAALLMHNVYPQWHRKRSYGSVINDCSELWRINLHRYIYKEQGIPKQCGGIRYLGIPKTYWRLYLHGLQQFLQIWLRAYSHPWQHGFQYGKGTKTAWEQILSYVIHSPNIYEFDLKKYFDTINLDYLHALLLRLSLPKTLADHIINWSRKPASNSKTSRISWESDSERAHVYCYYKTKRYRPLSNFEISYWCMMHESASKVHPHLSRYDYYHGVAQGSSISPLLSTLPITLDLFLKDLCKVVQYADDGILYDLLSSPEEILQFPPESGIKVNWSKSGWIRRDGKWLKPLKFCGMIFNPFDSGIDKLFHGGSLQNATRHLKKYTFDKFKVIHEAAKYDWWYEGSPGPYPHSAEDWFLSRYFGYVMSMIFNGNFEQQLIRQDFTYSFTKWSWSDLEQRRKQILTNKDLVVKYNGMYDDTSMNIYNSSSYCALALCKRLHHTHKRKRTNGFDH